MLVTDATSNLKQQITAAMKEAMRAKDKRRLGTIRLIQAGIKQKEVDERITLDDAQVLVILDKMLKQRRESLRQYEQANRQDLVDQEAFEIDLIQEFMPTQLSDDELAAIVIKTIQETQANSARDMGKIMKILKSNLQGKADMSKVSKLVKEKLT
jgi:uncharacterized protein